MKIAPSAASADDDLSLGGSSSRTGDQIAQANGPLTRLDVRRWRVHRLVSSSWFYSIRLRQRHNDNLMRCLQIELGVPCRAVPCHAIP